MKEWEKLPEWQKERLLLKITSEKDEKAEWTHSPGWRSQLRFPLPRSMEIEARTEGGAVEAAYLKNEAKGDKQKTKAREAQTLWPTAGSGDEVAE